MIVLSLISQNINIDQYIQERLLERLFDAFAEDECGQVYMCLSNKIKQKEMNTLNFNFPKLKSHSQSETAASNKFPISKLSTAISTPKQTPLTLQERLNSIKYQYINKSPAYFKRREHSVESMSLRDDSSKTIEAYLGEQGKMLDKQLLLELAKSRIKRMQKRQFQKNNYEEQHSGVDGLHLMAESKYQKFRPMRMPVRHTIKCIKHPQFTQLQLKKQTI